MQCPKLGVMELWRDEELYLTILQHSMTPAMGFTIHDDEENCDLIHDS
jgi:hypothetical protein